MTWIPQDSRYIVYACTMPKGPWRSAIIPCFHLKIAPSTPQFLVPTIKCRMWEHHIQAGLAFTEHVQHCFSAGPTRVDRACNIQYRIDLAPSRRLRHPSCPNQPHRAGFLRILSLSYTITYIEPQNAIPLSFLWFGWKLDCHPLTICPRQITRS